MTKDIFDNLNDVLHADGKETIDPLTFESTFIIIKITHKLEKLTLLKKYIDKPDIRQLKLIRSQLDNLITETERLVDSSS